MTSKGEAMAAGKRRDRRERWFAWHMRKRREEVELSWYQLSERLEASGYPLYQAALKAIEDGTRAVKLNDAVAISEVLGLSLEEMLRPPTVEDVRRELEVLVGAPWSVRASKDFREIHDFVAARHDRLDHASWLVDASPEYGPLKTTVAWLQFQDQRRKVSEVLQQIDQAEREIVSLLKSSDGDRG